MGKQVIVVLGLNLRLIEHPEKEGLEEQTRQESIFSQATTATHQHILGYASDRGDQLSGHLKASHFLGRPMEWKPRDAPIELIISYVNLADRNLGEPSPLSSPLGPLSESPESESGLHHLSLQTDRLRSSAGSVSSGYDPLSRSATISSRLLNTTLTLPVSQQISVIRE